MLLELSDVLIGILVGTIVYRVDQAGDRYGLQIEQIHSLESKNVEFCTVRDENATGFGSILDELPLAYNVANRVDASRLDVISRLPMLERF